MLTLFTTILIMFALLISPIVMMVTVDECKDGCKKQKIPY